MEEIEKFFKCPYCHENISMLLDVSVNGEQSYIEDCEVCCHPIQLTYFSEANKAKSFKANKATE